MLYSLNGTAISFLSNTDKGSIPVIRTNPLALYGDSLVYWFDFTDTSTLFSNTGATTSISGYGDTIRAVRSKSSYGQLITATTTGFTYSAKTNLNGYGGLYRTLPSSNTTTFLNETINSIVTANTLYGLHMAFSWPINSTALDSWFFKIAGFGTTTNGRLYFNQNSANRIRLANSGNTGDDLRTNSNIIGTPGVPLLDAWNGSFYVFSMLVNFSAATNIGLYDMPINSTKTMLNNNYFGPRRHTLLLNSTGTIKLQLGGGAPTGTFVQELILYQKVDNDEMFRAGHQYLRDKYLS
jgi:hypothetical protein